MSAEAFLRGIATDSYDNKVKASANRGCKEITVL